MHHFVKIRTTYLTLCDRPTFVRIYIHESRHSAYLISDAYRINQSMTQTAFESSLRSQIWSICSSINLATESIDPMTGGRLGHRIDTPPYTWFGEAVLLQHPALSHQ